MTMKRETHTHKNGGMTMTRKMANWKRWFLMGLALVTLTLANVACDDTDVTVDDAVELNESPLWDLWDAGKIDN